LIHSLFLSPCYFFPIYCTIPNDLKFFKHVANLPWRMNPKKHHHLRHFFMQMWPCEVNCLFFGKVKKMIFVNSNINILQFAWWKFLKFFPHILKPMYYRILWLHVSKYGFFLNFGACPRNGSFGAFLVKIQSRNLRS